MSKTKCSSENPATCRYHGHEAQVEFVKKAQRQAEASKDFDGYVKATKTLEALNKRQQIIAGIDAALTEAVSSGDFSRYLSIAETLEQKTGISSEKEDLSSPEKTSSGQTPKTATLQDRYDEDGYIYVSALSEEVANGTYHPDRIHSVNEYGEDVAYVRADSYNFQNYPDNMRIQASRPLTDAEVQKVAQLTGYQHRATLNGEGLSNPERCGNASVLVGTDNTKSSGRKTHFTDFEDGLEPMLQEGSPIRKTERSGPGTKGTRLVEGFGQDVTFTLYYEDDSVKFKK